jgi:hypothetical protein
MDFSALRAKTLGSGADEEAVTVNTRALIDKVLARYSGEWTVLRELLQNAADASATRVTIKFETIPSSTVPLPQNPSPSDLLKHTVQYHTLKRLVVSNNGQVFNENDWARLKRIAEGNPDETKIGAFGVGFYSTFADCEEPFISSGNEAMAFYWKGNSLFTRRLQLSTSESSSDTNFVLDYRDTSSSIPALLPLAQFLASSLTFVGIEQIDLSLDEWKLLSLSKKTAPSEDIVIPRDIETKTSEGLMKVTKVSREVAQIDGNWMEIIAWRPPQKTSTRLNDRDNAPSLRTFFSRLAGSSRDDEKTSKATKSDVPAVVQDFTMKASATVFLHVNTASIKTSTGPNFNQELERATKKPPPKTTKLALLTVPYVEHDTLATSKSGSDVFATILPSRSGRIFIGFPTHQTTGLNAHISAPSVIPTVERESIDLNARYVRKWNIEMLRAAGIVCRVAFATEMEGLKEKLRRSTGGKIRSADVQPMLAEAIAIAKNFTFRESTPASQTGQILEEAFWKCSKRASIEVLSTCGVLPTYEVRIAPKDLSFMDNVPILPESIALEAKPFVDKLVEIGLLNEINVSDIKKALEATALSSQHLGEFLNWLAKQSSKGQLDSDTVNNLLSVAVANDEAPNGTASRVLVLGSIQFFMSPTRIPTDLPVPATVMPFRYTKSLRASDMESFGWQELQVVTWVRFLIEESGNRSILPESQDITKSATFSAQVLPVISKQWDALSQSSKATLVELLRAHTIIPTKLGMRKPVESYFPSVKLFNDLPIIHGLQGVKDKVLLALGVRKTIELGLVFDRLLATSPQTTTEETKTRWSHVELVQYLASVRDDIPSTDIQRLKETPMCPRGNTPGTGVPSDQKFKVSELFEPRPALRELGLPILEWPGLYRSGSPEGKFLSLLGLRTIPSVLELINIMAYAGSNGDSAARDKAINFFLSNHHANGYANFDYSKVSIPFLPLENKPDKLSNPSKCFVDGGAALLGFDILKADLQSHASKFGVRMHPPIDVCINILSQKPPTGPREARALFAYFAGRLNELNGTNIPRLSDLKFIPVSKKSEKESKLRYVSPKNCFLGDSDTYGEIFDYVDFGHEANAFLLKCGSKPEPTKIEIAEILVREPARISSTFRNPERYLNLLRNLAQSISVLKKNKDLFREMRRAPFLLASKEIVAVESQSDKKLVARVEEIDDLDEDEFQGIKEWQLTSAEHAIIVDDYQNYSLFKTSILAAPQEETLEDFYYSLGTPLLSSLVEEAARHGPRAADQGPAKKLVKQIHERSRLFLHDQPPDTIKHDTKWLEKNLQVQLVSSISLKRSLKGRDVSHVEKRSAVITQVNREYTLWVVGERPDLYQVSQSLISLLLNRPKPHSALTLEMLLKTDLTDLRNRGFNVGRILRQKAAEARLAESQRQQELEQEQKRIAEQEKAWQESQQQASAERAQRKGLPGQFPESPESRALTQAHEQSAADIDNELTETRRQGRNLFSNITRGLGIGEGRRHLQSMLGHNPSQNSRPQQQEQQAITNGEADPPPPYTNGQPKQITSQPVTAPHQLRENLLSAIKKTRAHNSTSIFSRGETNEVTETQSYCDEHPAHDLSFVAELQHGIQMFLSPSSTGNTSQFLSSHSTGLTSFASLLKEVAAIFSLDPRTVNIFFEPNGKTIAFNRNGSIFCNYLYFQQLHEQHMKSQGSTGRGDAMVYWFVIFCHEISHNLVADHSSQHSYYTEGFMVQYFGKVAQVVAAMGAGPPAQRVLVEL